MSWISQIFRADVASNGGVVRRSKKDVEKFSSMAELIGEAKKQSYHVIETGGQVVVLCHAGEVVIHA